MKVLILSFTFVSFFAFTGEFEECEIFSEKAKVIMELRQNKNSIDLVISEIDKKYIIIAVDAFNYDHVDVLGQLTIKIESFGLRSFKAESRKYNKMESKRNNIINKFKNKYLLQCLKIKPQQ